MRSILLTICCFIISSFTLFSQTTEELNLARYWKYRERFNNYFTYQGSQNGEGLVVCIRNRELSPNMMQPNLGFGQHGIHFGYYLGVLSTEYLLLSVYNQTEAANNTFHELQLVLTAYEEQLDKCENIWGKEKVVDGFFVRENVPTNFLSDTIEYGRMHKTHFNQGLTPENVWDKNQANFAGVPKGHPGWVDVVDVREASNKEPMSQDEAYGMMMGLALVARCVPELHDRAADLLEKITLHIINKNPNYHCSGISYYIYKPNCQKVSESAGGNTGAMGYGIAAAAASVTGKDFETFMNPYSNKQVKSVGEKPYNRKFYDRLLRSGNIKLLWNIVYYGAPGEQEWNRSMISTLAAIGDSWYPDTEKGIANNALHTSGTRANHDWRSFYLTLWRFLYGHEGNMNEKSLIMSELSSAPWEGPYNYVSPEHPDNHAEGGWAHEYRYRATFDEQYKGRGHKGVFNGLDYMLMYNLYQLVYGTEDKSIPPYVPASNENLQIQSADFIQADWNLKDKTIFEQKIKKKK